MKKLINKISVETLHYAILLQAGIAMAGSLFFSEVMNLPPCVLCWYQRIALYPLAVLIPIGVWKKQSDLATTILALAIPGALIGLYHNLLVWKIIPESIAPCVQGVSCTTQIFSLFGFITIPFLALMSFCLLIAGALVIRRLQRLNP